PKALREACRVDDVGEQNGADSGVALVFRAARNECGTRRIHFGSAEESFSDFGLDLDDLRCDQAVRFTMHGGCRFGARSAAEAENLAGFFVEPVLVISDAVLRLRLDIGDMRLRNGFRSGTIDFVDVDGRRHGQLGWMW